MDKPVLSKQAFWDVDMDNIDYEKNALFVMERVLKADSFQDFITLKKFYGENKWREEIINSKNLNSMDANFCCTIFNLKIEDFKYNIAPYSYPSWDYSGA